MITRNVKFQPGKLMIWLVLLVSLFFFDVLLLQAQVYPGTNFRFDRLTHEDGLSSNFIGAVIQDSRGFLWVGTSNGLNRYDGYQFKQYRYHINELPGLGQGYVNAIFEDSRKNLWIGTENGLSRFNRETDTFTLYKCKPATGIDLGCNVIFSIFEDDSGTLLIGSKDGLHYFDYEQEQIVELFRATADQAPNLRYHIINDIYQDHMGTLWLATSSGMYRRGPDAAVKNNFVRFEQVPNGTMLKIFEDSHRNLWIGSWGGGAYRVDLETGTAANFHHDPGNPNSLSSSKVLSIEEDAKGYLLFGTADGLNRFDPESGKMVHFRHDENNPQSLSSDNIKCLFKDNNNILWIGTGYGGLNKYNPAFEVFEHFTRSDTEKNSLSSNQVLAFAEDEEENIWIGTENGLNVLKVAVGKFDSYHYDPRDPGSISSNYITALNYGADGTLWIGTDKGLNRFDRRTGTFKRYQRISSEPATLSNNFIYSIYQDNAGIVWVGTWGGGLNRFDPVTEQFIRYQHDASNPMSLRNDDIRDILEDPGNPDVLWLATYAGLEKFSKKTGKVTLFAPDPENPNSISHYNIMDLEPDKTGSFWIAGMGGLNHFDIATEKFTRYDSIDVRLGREILGSLVDDHENLWLLSLDGLLYYNRMANEIKIFSEADGLQGNQFNPHSTLKCESGKLYFGGDNGFNRFFPEQIAYETAVPPVVISGLTYFDHKQQGKAIGIPGISDKKEIEISYQENIFTIEFAALNFTRPAMNQFAYKLEGLNDAWFQLGTRHEITMTNLDPGTYTLFVKAANKDEIWNETPVLLKIIITPPWWRTNWAYAFYLAVLLLLLAGIRRYELNRQKYKHDLEMEKIEAQKLLEVDSMKSRFFANISHEFRTPLTLILGHLLIAVEKTSESDLNGKLKIAYRNGQRLLQLINQLLDLSKLEARMMTLNAETNDLVLFLKNIIASFDSLAQQKGLRLELRPEMEHLALNFEPEKLEQVFMNLISNAVKFTPEGGRIIVTVELPAAEGNGPAYAIIRVADSGTGIPQNQLAQIFNRFYQVDDSKTRAYEGTGIGLALVKELVELHNGSITVSSVVGEGTQFEIRLPWQKTAIIPLAESNTAVSSKQAPEPDSVLSAAALASAEKLDADGREIILIVEDNREIRDYLRGILTEKYFVLEAADGAEGLQLALKTIPNLMITDVMMPNIDGFTLARKIREDERVSHIPVIMLTARASDSDKITGLETGVDDYLVKPFNPNELQVRVKNILQMRARLRKRFSSALIIKPEEVSVVPADKLFMQKLINEIGMRLEDEHFSASEVSDALGMSLRTLTRKLNSLIDQSPAQLIRSMRLQRAAELLKKQAGSVAEIAYRVGFSDQANFTRSFKKEFKQSPSEYARTASEP
jgi:signal transduction histidine kinase/ligand-binding sensor domain-containing protein/DNA-binding response OmpR family regulator